MTRLIVMSGLALLIVVGALMVCRSDEGAASTGTNAAQPPHEQSRSAAKQPKTRPMRPHSQQTEK